MQLVSLAFSEFPGEEAEWTLEQVSFSRVNLLVGRNAVGKTRVINVINYLSELLLGQQKETMTRGRYSVDFASGDKTWKYAVEFENKVVVKEDLFYDKSLVLHRAQGGYGKILAEDVGDKPLMIKFSVDGSKVAVQAKRDDAQHSFLAPLNAWAQSVRLFRLGTEINPHALAIALKQPIPIPVNEKETSGLVPIFDKAKKELGDRYIAAIIADMKEVGYDITAVEIRRPTHLVTNAILPGELVGVAVREKDLRCFVDQPSMSQGMFRAFSLLAQVNYYVLSKRDACVLADDIGEGLDYERSCALINVLRRKSQESPAHLQLVMSTNNRFVMNKVPLEEWCLLRREGHHVVARNYRNAAAAFERFKATGLNNFDLLRTDFLEKALPNG